MLVLLQIPSSIFDTALPQLFLHFFKACVYFSICNLFRKKYLTCFFSAALLCFSQCSAEEQSGSQEKHNWKSGRNCLKELVHACPNEFELNCLIDY